MIDRLRALISRLGGGDNDGRAIGLFVGSQSVSVQIATIAKVLVALVVVSAGTFVAGIAFLGVGSQSVLAADVTANDVSITTNDGEITAVSMNPALSVSWSGLDDPLKQLVVQIKISNSSDVADENLLEGSQFLDCDVESHPDCGETSGNATFDYGDENINLLNKSRYTYRNNDTLFNASDFAAADGETKTTTVYFEILVRADMTDGTSKFYTKQLSFNVAVTNEGSTTSVEGTLNTSVTG